MARMASRPRIGAIIRDAMERKRMDQIQLAAALDVSRSAVNSWIHDRTWPRNRVAALEDLLDIEIPRWDEDESADSDLDSHEETLMGLDLDPEEQEKLIKAYRAIVSGDTEALKAIVRGDAEHRRKRAG